MKIRKLDAVQQATPRLVAKVLGFLLLTPVFTACDGDGSLPDAGSSDEFICESHALDCVDELKVELSLSTGTTATQSIVNDLAEGVFLSEVDATAGGVAADPRQPFLYARFEEDGLQVVALSDDEALSSDAWDIAFHRYIVRLNGGSSGPSCAQAAKVAGGFDEVTSVEESSLWISDDQFTDECIFRAELEAGDPANERDYGLALHAYYEYVGCLQMTQQTFTVRLDAERQIKLKVLRFYDEGPQLDCDELGSNIPVGSAHLVLQWAFIGAP